jgi:cation diffusion facilitator CzcD-associated flavoprotein CzcO
MYTLPVAVIGAGPTGLAAAAHVLAHGETPIVFEAGPRVGAACSGVLGAPSLLLRPGFSRVAWDSSSRTGTPHTQVRAGSARKPPQQIAEDFAMLVLAESQLN